MTERYLLFKVKKCGSSESRLLIITEMDKFLIVMVLHFLHSVLSRSPHGIGDELKIQPLCLPFKQQERMREKRYRTLPFKKIYQNYFSCHQ